VEFIRLSQEQTKRWTKLKQKKYRVLDQKFIVEGLRLLVAAEAAHQNIEAVIVTDQFQEEAKGAEILHRIQAPIYLADEKNWKRISETVHGQGILAIVSMEELLESEQGWSQRILILDRIQDPGNLGTILRTAEAFGFRDIFLTRGCVDCYDSKVIRSSMGGIFSLQLHIWKSDSLDEAKAKGYQCIASSLRDSDSLPDVYFEDQVALIIGNEANGIRKDWIESANLRVQIPMTGQAESLNAGIAAGILMYAIQSHQRIDVS
jgi:TrmH family RNA methyltransferase